MSNAPTLDPDDWDAFRDLAHRAVDDMVSWLEGQGDGPVWSPIPELTRAALSDPLPPHGVSADAVYREFLDHVLPHTLGNTDPRFHGWVHGGGTPIGALAEFLAGTVNANLGGREHAPVLIERQVLDWCRSLFGFPASSSGILLSGTSRATVVALAVARYRADRNVRAEGVKGTLVGYTSAAAHNSIVKAFELLGLGHEALRIVETDADGSMDPGALERRIDVDRAAGLDPFAIIATVGAVNTGAFDDLRALREVGPNLWLHVDGAFGAAARLSPRFRDLVDGIDTVDSLAFDFHKWLQVPYDAGCVLIRDGELHRATFQSRRNYLSSQAHGPASGEPWFCDFGPELSRGFRALKVWFTLRHYGTDRLGRMVEDACDCAAHLARRIDGTDELERLAPVPLNVVCFGVNAPGLSPDKRDRLNADLLLALHERGHAVPSPTRIDGRYALRACICNHRTRPEHMDALVDHSVRIAREVLAP